MKEKLISTKESIALTAIEILGELGTKGLTSKEIAARENISEGTIYRHYNSKNDIISAVLDQYTKFDNDIQQSIRMKRLDFCQSIMFYITSYAKYYQNYPAIATIAHVYDAFLNEPELAGRINDILDQRSIFIKQLADQAKSNGEISGSVDTEGFATLLIGSFCYIVYKWRMDQCKYSLKEKAQSIARLVLTAFSVSLCEFL